MENRKFYGNLSYEDRVIKLLLNQTEAQLSVMQKFADVAVNKILEENLCISNDHSELLFKIAWEKAELFQPTTLTLDLVKQEIKIWQGNFEELVLTSSNPYSRNSIHYAKLALLDNKSQQAYIKSHITLKVKVVAYSVKEIQKCQRSLQDNR